MTHFPPKFWSVHSIDTLLSHEAMVEDEWQCSDVIDAGRSRDSNNMVDVVHSNFIHTTHIHTV